MHFGIALPHIGPTASVAAILEVARRAEELGFESLWVLDRLLYPVNPASKYPGNSRGAVPIAMQITYEPLTVLAFVAAVTEKLRLGTSVLVAPFRNPVLMAKTAATLDQLSGGRLILGLGAGWSADEFEAVGESFDARQAQTDEYLRVLRELWTVEQPSFSGTYYRVAPSIFLPQPVQKYGPPIWIGGNSRRAMRRAAEFGDGWHPTSRMAPAVLAAAMKSVREMAESAGRKAEAVQLTLRWNASPWLTRDFVADRTIRRLSEYRDAGVEHVCIDFNIPQPSTVSEMLESMEILTHQVIPEI